MDLFEKVTGTCEIRNRPVDILLLAQKRSKHREGAARTPFRCMSAAECSRSAFCRFVNPLTARIPVNLEHALEYSRPETEKPTPPPQPAGEPDIPRCSCLPF